MIDNKSIYPSQLGRREVARRLFGGSEISLTVKLTVAGRRSTVCRCAFARFDSHPAGNGSGVSVAQYFLTSNQMSKTTNRPRYNVVVKTGTDAKPIWHQIGAAFETKSGGLSVRLHAAPIDGQLWLFEPKTKSDEPFTA